MIYQRVTSNVKNFTRQLWNYPSTKNLLLKELHILAKALNKIDNEPGYFRIEVLKNIRKLTDCFLKIIDEETASLENRTLFTALKEYATLIKHLGQCIWILMSILSIVVQYMKTLMQILMPKFGAITASLINQSKATC